MSDTVVIILNWNGKQHLHTCFSALRAQQSGRMRVVCVDNGSTDGSVGYMKAEFPDVEVIELPENIGFAGGNNMAISKLLQDVGLRYFIFLNNDTEVKAGWLSALIERAESDERIGMVASKILFGDPPVIQSSGMFATPDIKYVNRGVGRPVEEFPDAEEVLSPCGASFLVKRRVIEEVGMFEEMYFSYGEDVEWGIRARAAGWKVMYEPRSVVHHFHSQTTGAKSPKKAYYGSRNALLTAYTHFPVSMIIMKILRVYKRLFFYLRYGKKKQPAEPAPPAPPGTKRAGSRVALVGAMLRGVGSSILLLPWMLKKRRQFYEARSTKQTAEIIKRFELNAEADIKRYLSAV